MRAVLRKNETRILWTLPEEAIRYRRLHTGGHDARPVVGREIGVR